MAQPESNKPHQKNESRKGEKEYLKHELAQGFGNLFEPKRKSDYIRVIYEQGLEAVAILIDFLLTLITRQRAAINELQVENKALRARLATDSHNSHKPPASDAFKPRPKSLRPKSNRKPGGQEGHQGHTLLLVEKPDRIVPHSPERCQTCSYSLAEVPVKRYEKRQVFDLPPTRLEVVEHRAEIKECPKCHQESKGEFPKGVVNPTQYGERVKALGVYLTTYQLLPYERTSELMGDLFGCSISEGSLLSAIAECYAGLEETEEQIKEGVRCAGVAHFDETGMRVEEKNYWVHVASTERLTHYGCHKKRGKEATDTIGILPGFSGVAMHDGLSFYQKYNCRHALCNAHHLRELTFVEEEYGQGWARELKELLLKIKEAVDRTKAEGSEGFEEWQVRMYEEQYRELLAKGVRTSPELRVERKRRGRKRQGKVRNLLARLSRYKEQVLAFLHNFKVPFDNNLVERDLRMMKVKCKISGCFRTEKGASWFCRIRGYISTLRKQGQDTLLGLQLVFSGKPFVPT